MSGQLAQVVYEYWDVPEENEAAFLDYYRTVIIAGLSSVDGYAGTHVLREFQLPGWTRVVQPHFGTHQLGVVTNATINLGVLLSNEYTILLTHQFTALDPQMMPKFFEALKEVIPDWRTRHADKPDAPASSLWLDQLTNLYEFEGTGDTGLLADEVVADAVQITKVMSHDFFSLVNNHWDTFYTVPASWQPLST